jgi:hypothetical protein
MRARIRSRCEAARGAEAAAAARVVAAGFRLAPSSNRLSCELALAFGRFQRRVVEWVKV